MQESSEKNPGITPFMVIGYSLFASLFCQYRQQQRLQEREWLVSERTEQQEQHPDMDVDGDDKSHEYEEPFLRQEARPVLMYEERRPLDSSTESFDPLYDRVTKSSAVADEVQPGPSTEEEKIKTEPVYAQVKRLENSFYTMA